MRVLITGADAMLAAELRGALQAGHEVLTSIEELGDGTDAVVRLGYDGSAGEKSRPSHGSAEALALLDAGTRQTYDLLLAAAEAGVRRCIYLSTLRLLEEYPSHFTVTERTGEPCPPRTTQRCWRATSANSWPGRSLATACSQ